MDLSERREKQTSRKRNKVNLELKRQVIEEHEAGKTNTNIARTFKLPESTIRTILKNKQKIKETAACVSLNARTQICRTRSTGINRVETMLHTWIIDQRRKNVPLDTMTILRKARSLHGDLNSEQDVSSNVKCEFSEGWFARFKARYNLTLRNVRLHGVGEANSANSNKEDIPPLKKDLVRVISDNNYSLKQIYNAKETSLYWKQMQGRSFVLEEECKPKGVKMQKDRLTLLFTGNASGDAKLKPLLIHRSRNPHALKNVKRETLPVIWQHNKGPRMTGRDFVDWFSNHFVPFVSAYNIANNLQDKALLILDNFAGHPTTVCEMFPHIKVIFVPPNTTSLIHPMDQGIIANFKAAYIRTSMNRLASSLAETGEIKSYWKKFDIKDAVDIIGEAWGKVNNSTMSNVWKRLLLPTCDFTEITNGGNLKAYNLETLQLMHQIGFENVQQEDIDEMITQNNDEMTNEELLQIEYFPLDDVDADGLAIHTITNTEGPAENHAEKDEIRKQFLETAEEFKRLAALLEKNPKRHEAFNLGVDSLTRYKIGRRDKKARTRATFSEEAMREAVKLVSSGESLRKVSEKRDISKSTLQRYVNNARSKHQDQMSFVPNYSVRRIFTTEEEMSLQDYIIKCSKMNYGLTKENIKQLAYELALKNKKSIPENWTANKMAGDEWLIGFIKRHSTLSLRQPEDCSIGRAITGDHGVPGSSSSQMNNGDNVLDLSHDIDIKNEIIDDFDSHNSDVNDGKLHSYKTNVVETEFINIKTKFEDQDEDMLPNDYNIFDVIEIKEEYSDELLSVSGENITEDNFNDVVQNKDAESS